MNWHEAQKTLHCDIFNFQLKKVALMNVDRIYMFLFVLCLVSCSEEIETQINEEENSRIRFFAGVSNGVEMRASINTEFKTAFEENDSIGLFIYKRSVGEEPSINKNLVHSSNIKLVYKNGNWELDSPLYYPGSKRLLDIYAYYPYKEDAEVHALEYDAGKEMKELMIASVIGVEKSENAIILQFGHTQSMTHVTLTKDNTVPSFDESLEVYFNGIVGGKYNIATRELAEPITGIIKMNLLGDVYEDLRRYIAFVPEQEASPGILFSIFQMTSDKTILSSKDIDHYETFTRGEVKFFRIRIKQEISKDIVYGLYDLYPRYGTPVGMVIEVYGQGKNGKVISLKNVERTAWAVPNAVEYVTGATDYNDGISNKMKVQTIENWEVNYPAFKACVEYGERWYLPCIGEMQWFLTNTYNNGNRLSTINNNLNRHKDSNPGLIIETVHLNQSYFSSTESWVDSTRAVKLYTGGSFDTPHEPKEWEYYIRPFYEF